jgi:hypothetical protein
MRSAIERYIEDLARTTYKEPVFARKKVDNFDIEQWSSAEGSRRIVFSFSETAVVIGNDQESVVRSLRARTDRNVSLNGKPEFQEARNRINASTPSVAAYVSNSGVKSLLQAYWLDRNRTSSDVVTEARIFADIVGGVVKNVAWSARFNEGFVDDRCSINLVEGVADRLRGSVSPNGGPDLTRLTLIPSNAYSFSLYQFGDTSTLWSDLNVALSAHTDVIGAMAARAMLRSVFRPYGIAEPERFVHAIGRRLYTIRLAKNDPAVLVAEALDRPALRRIALLRLGPTPSIEQISSAELLLSTTDNWSAAFTDKYFLIGPAHAVRRCLSAEAEGQSISVNDPFRKSQSLVDVTLPIISLTFTNDQASAISFVEAFSNHQRSAFAANAPEIEKASRTLPLAVSATILKESTIEWTGRSAFGVGGSIVNQIFPESLR